MKMKYQFLWRVMVLQIQIISKTHNDLYSRKVLNIAKICADKLLLKNYELSIVFLHDKEMKSINEQYTGRKGSTDVLSFDLGKNLITKNNLGEVIISIDKAGKQAEQRSVTVFLEIIRLIVHGVTHLAGYDHCNLKTYKEMRKIEFKLLIDCLRSYV